MDLKPTQGHQRHWASAVRSLSGLAKCDLITWLQLMCSHSSGQAWDVNLQNTPFFCSVCLRRHANSWTARSREAALTQSMRHWFSAVVLQQCWGCCYRHTMAKCTRTYRSCRTHVWKQVSSSESSLWLTAQRMLLIVNCEQSWRLFLCCVLVRKSAWQVRFRLFKQVGAQIS